MCRNSKQYLNEDYETERKMQKINSTDKDVILRT